MNGRSMLALGQIAGTWAVYGSSVDNITGDAWTNKGYSY